MTKIHISNDSIKAFGGLNFVSSEFDAQGLPDLITNILGKRSLLAEYEYSDIIKTLWLILFAGGDCAEDVQSNLKSELGSVDNLKLCSADTILRVLKKLKTEKEVHYSNAGVLNEFSNNDLLNELLMAVLLKLNQLQPDKLYDLDFDNQFIPCEKYDAKKSYKMKKGYFPGVASIGKHIVYLENRNGNSNVKYKQHETLDKVFNQLKNNGIRIDRSRMDCGSFTREIVKTVEANSNTFFIRARKCDDLTEKIRQVNDWEKVQIGCKDVEVCSIMYKPFNQEKQYRYVVSREANKTGQLDVFTNTNFIYRAIITNDFSMTNEQVVTFYNQRGASERIFDEMNNDFGWKNVPFSFLEENTVFMILTAICRNFYLYVLAKFSIKLPFSKVI